MVEWYQLLSIAAVTIQLAQLMTSAPAKVVVLHLMSTPVLLFAVKTLLDSSRYRVAFIYIEYFVLSLPVVQNFRINFSIQLEVYHNVSYFLYLELK